MKGVEGHDPRKIETKDHHTPITPEAFALLGGGKIAYVKPMRSEKAAELFPQAPQLAPGANCSRCTPPTARRSC